MKIGRIIVLALLVVICTIGGCKWGHQHSVSANNASSQNMAVIDLPSFR